MDTTKAEKVEKVKCISCRQEVEVVKVPYGTGHVAKCPKCGRLAYNGK